MDEDAFNMSVRKFLKKLGVTAQREIEIAVRQELAAGNLRGDESLDATATGRGARASARSRRTGRDQAVLTGAVSPATSRRIVRAGRGPHTAADRHRRPLAKTM